MSDQFDPGVAAVKAMREETGLDMLGSKRVLRGRAIRAYLDDPFGRFDPHVRNVLLAIVNDFYPEVRR